MRTTAPTAARWLAVPVVATTFVAGVWLFGGVVAGTFRTAMALTALWYLVAAAVCIALVRAQRTLLVPVALGYVVAAGAVGGYLAISTIRERVVDERVVTGPLAASGTFSSGEHDTVGTARVVRLAGGRQVLTLTRFDTSPGPDLRVRVAPRGGTDGSADGVLDLGALKGDRGDQQYELPRGFRAEGASVLIWCRAFSALFGSARLRAA